MRYIFNQMKVPVFLKYFFSPQKSAAIIRQKIRKKRRKISAEKISHLSNKIVDALTKTNVYAQSKNIGIYLTNEGEPDLTSLLKLSREDKNFYLPVMDPKNSRQLTFVLYKNGDVLQKNKFGILEPKLTRTNTIAPENLDLVIAPLVAFDITGSRIGRGGGYYDKTFSFKLHGASRKPTMIGVAYDWQLVSKISRKETDVPLDSIITDGEIVYFSIAMIDNYVN
jgi:5-formyltetrahydrofolate cyclo-ligase